MRSEPGFLVLSLALTSIMSYYYLSSNDDGTSALTEEAAIINKHMEKDTNHLSYYGSIFSNLSRGLPIDEGDSSTETPNRQEEDQEINANSTTQEPS